jgi:hypothetical protein
LFTRIKPIRGIKWNKLLEIISNKDNDNFYSNMERIKTAISKKRELDTISKINLKETHPVGRKTMQYTKHVSMGRAYMPRPSSRCLTPYKVVILHR